METRERMRASRVNFISTSAGAEIMSKFNSKGLPRTAEWRARLSKANSGRIRSKETCRRISLARKGSVSGFKGKSHDAMANLKNRMAHLGISRPHSAIGRSRISAANTRWWKTATPSQRNVRVSNMLHGTKYYGGGLELQVAKMLVDLDIPSLQLNSSRITIGGKIPDFIDPARRIVLEAFGKYWHGFKITGRTRRQEESQRKRHFAKHGYRCVIIWEGELSKLKRKLSGLFPKEL